MDQKQLAMSVSTTHRRPRQHSLMSTCRASCADRLGRNPKLTGRKSASKTGSSTIFSAACTIRSRTGGIESGLCSPAGAPGLGIDPARGQRTIAAFLQLVGQLAEQPVYAVLFDCGQGDLVDARCAVVTAHRRPRAPQHVPAADLVIQRVESPSGIGLGRPVQRILQGTAGSGTGSAGISRPDPFAAGLAARALTGPLPDNAAHRRSSGPSLPAGCVVLRLNRYYGRLRRPPGQRSTSRGHRL